MLVVPILEYLHDILVNLSEEFSADDQCYFGIPLISEYSSIDLLCLNVLKPKVLLSIMVGDNSSTHPSNQ